MDPVQSSSTHQVRGDVNKDPHDVSQEWSSDLSSAEDLGTLRRAQTAAQRKGKKRVREPGNVEVAAPRRCKRVRNDDQLAGNPLQRVQKDAIRRLKAMAPVTSAPSTSASSTSASSSSAPSTSALSTLVPSNSGPSQRGAEKGETAGKKRKAIHSISAPSESEVQMADAISGKRRKPRQRTPPIRTAAVDPFPVPYLISPTGIGLYDDAGAEKDLMTFAPRDLVDGLSSGDEDETLTLRAPLIPHIAPQGNCAKRRQRRARPQEPSVSSGIAGIPRSPDGAFCQMPAMLQIPRSPDGASRQMPAILDMWQLQDGMVLKGEARGEEVLLPCGSSELGAPAAANRSAMSTEPQTPSVIPREAQSQILESLIGAGLLSNSTSISIVPPWSPPSKTLVPDAPLSRNDLIAACELISASRRSEVHLPPVHSPTPLPVSSEDLHGHGKEPSPPVDLITLSPSGSTSASTLQETSPRGKDTFKELLELAIRLPFKAQAGSDKPMVMGSMKMEEGSPRDDRPYSSASEPEPMPMASQPDPREREGNLVGFTRSEPEEPCERVAVFKRAST